MLYYLFIILYLVISLGPLGFFGGGGGREDQRFILQINSKHFYLILYFQEDQWMLGIKLFYIFHI